MLPYRPARKYVGPNNFLKWFIPRRPFGVDFNYPAYIHDVAYHEKTSKRTADLQFLYDCMAQVERKDWKYLPNNLMRHLSRFAALVYFAAVRDFGKNFY
jgi:hypothetical protein